MKTCPHCGKENLDRAKFCGYCGRNLTVESEITRRANETGESSAGQTEKTAGWQSLPPPKPARKSLLPQTLVLIVFLVIGSLVVIGLRTGQPDLSIVKNLAGLSMQFSTQQTPTATASPLPATITALPSATITPTLTPAPTNTPLPVRLAVRRGEIQSLFMNLGFSFQGTTPLDNQPRVIGRSIDKSISVELVGAADSITKITLIAGESNIGDQDMIVMVYMTRLLQRTLPDWGDAKDWLQFGLKQISDSPDPEAKVVTTTGSTRISLKLVKNMKLTFLSIEGESSPETPGATPITQAP